MEGIFDNHNHSQFSFDGKRTTIRLSAEAAAGKGLTGICFTDHYDAYVPPMKADFEHLVPETFDIEKQQKEITETILDTGYPILKGIEIGLHSKCRQEIRRILSINHFDQIIASVHYIDDTDPYYGSYYRDKDWKEAYGHYLETLYTEMKWLGDFDIMGHFDYIVRYAGYPENSMQYRYFSDIFDEIFKFLIEEGKARRHKEHQRSTNNHKSSISTIHKLSLSFHPPRIPPKSQQDPDIFSFSSVSTRVCAR